MIAYHYLKDLANKIANSKIVKRIAEFVSKHQEEIRITSAVILVSGACVGIAFGLTYQVKVIEVAKTQPDYAVRQQMLFGEIKGSSILDTVR